jgi:hypothetical protein
VLKDPILLFDRDHPSAPTCVRSSPSCRVVVTDGAFSATDRLVLDNREHGGRIDAQWGEDNKEKLVPRKARNS